MKLTYGSTHLAFTLLDEMIQVLFPDLGAR